MADNLPDLHLTDRHGDSVALSSLLASGPAVLYFLRRRPVPSVWRTRGGSRRRAPRDEFDLR